MAVSGEHGLVVVTGAAGFIGHALCAHFVATGRPHRALVRAIDPGAHTHSETVAIGDLATVPDERLDAALAGATAVVHLAGRAHVLRDRASDPDALYAAANALATARLAVAAARAGVARFVLASSVKVLGEATPPGRPFGADSPPSPQDAYARSKVEAERALAAECARGTTVPIVLRLPLVYGPGVKGNFLRLLDAVARCAPLPFGAIENRRDLLFVGNLVHAIAVALDLAEAPAGTWLVADGEPVSTPDLVRRLAAALGVAPRVPAVPVALLRVAARVAGREAQVARLTQSLEIDAAPLWQRVGVAPCTLDQGLTETARWWRARHAI